MVLHVREADSKNNLKSRFFVPTIAGQLPDVTSDQLFGDFVLDVNQEDWMQIELLPHSALPEIKQEITNIESILHPGKGVSLLWGYESRHVRKKWDAGKTAISFETFAAKINAIRVGAIRMCSSPEKFIKNGFAIHSDNWMYFGTLEHNFVKNLGIKQFDCVDYELMSILNGYEMVLVDWCNARIITSEMREEEGTGLNQSEQGESSMF